jgi:hypothetical protein
MTSKADDAVTYTFTLYKNYPPVTCVNVDYVITKSTSVLKALVGKHKANEATLTKRNIPKKRAEAHTTTLEDIQGEIGAAGLRWSAHPYCE